MTFLPVGGGGLLPGLSLRAPGIPMRINFNYFLDRKAVIDRIGKAKARALSRAGLKVAQTAKKSIKKKGMSKPALKVMKTYEGMSLEQISKLEGATEARQGIKRDSAGRFLRGSGALRSVDGQITEADRKKVLERLKEIRDKTGSPAGTPPFTWTGMLRDDIGFAYDMSSESVVVGSYMRGGAWLASLHEFGGRQQVRAWQWVPKYPRGSIIFKWMRIGKQPTDKSKWVSTNMLKVRNYPRRPYMGAAIRKCVANKTVVNSFRVGGLGN